MEKQIQFNKKAEVNLVLFGLSFAFACDRLSKNWALSHLAFNTSTPFLPGLLNLRLVENTGAAFSLGRDNAGLMTMVASAVSVFLLLWTVNRLRKATFPAPLERLGAGVLLGGALGNLGDRFHQGHVTDFLEFAFINFPIFNIADSLIDLGIVLICIAMLKERQHEDAAR